MFPFLLQAVKEGTWYSRFPRIRVPIIRDFHLSVGHVIPHFSTILLNNDPTIRAVLVTGVFQVPPKTPDTRESTVP